MIIQTDYYKLTASSNFLLIESFLDWDSRIAEQFARDTAKIVMECFKDVKWCILHDARAWGAGTPGVERVIRTLVTSRISGTLTHHAYVTGSSAMHQWQAGKVFSSITSFSHQMFEHLDDATAWLASFGYLPAREAC